MSQLAADYSMSDVGLAKLCDRHDIPTPPRGYWALFKVGRAPERPPLPASEDARPIVLRPAGNDVTAADSKDELETAIANEKRRENRIVVAERLSSPHPLV